MRAHLGQEQRVIAACPRGVASGPNGSADNDFSSAMLAIGGHTQIPRLCLLRSAADIGVEMAMLWLGNLAFFDADLVDDTKYWWEAAAAAGGP